MSEHLPECADAMIPDFHNERWVCICAALRACEQRMYEWSKSFGVGKAFYDAGRLDALDAAEAAIAAVENDPDAQVDYDRDYMADPSGNTRNPRMWMRDALAAIDALREEKR